MSTPNQSNTGLQLSDANGEGETECASISRHVEAPELANTVNLPAVAIEIQKDFLTSIHAGVRRRFPKLTSHVSVDSNTKIPVLTISQRRLFVWNGVAYSRVCAVQNIFSACTDEALEKGKV